MTNDLSSPSANRFRFRAWDSIAKTMFTDLFLKNTRLCGFADDGYTIMQSTGLTDKNGKEIFEGDIAVSGDGETTWEVKWSWGGFVFCNSDNDARNLSCHLIHADRILYVIGNIYENPDLLPTSDVHP